MAASTVTQRQRRASDTEVNKRSGFLQTLLGKRASEDDEFKPDEQSLWLFERVGKDLRGELDKLAGYLVAKVRENHAAPYGENRQVGPFNTHPKPLLRALTNRAVDLESDPLAGARYSVEVLLPLWEQLLAEAAEEGQAQDRFERRTLANQQAVATKAQRLEVAASDQDEDAQLKTATVVTANGEEKEYLPGTASRIVANALRASDPEPTALQMALTPDVLERMDAARAEQLQQTAVLPVIETVTVAAPVSPVHAHDGIAPAIPAADEVADPGELKPLPRRVPQRRPVDVLPYSDKDPYAAVDPTIEGRGLASGAWVFDEGTGSGGPVWFLLAEQEDALRDRGRVAVLKFANGSTREVDAGKQVKVLDVRRAQVLVAQIEQRLAARDAEQEASS